MSSFFLLEKAKCLVQKYRNRFHWKCLIETTETLECKALKNQSATFFSTWERFHLIWPLLFLLF